jgi:hypothetical protein
MRAIVAAEFGGYENLKLADIPKPALRHFHLKMLQRLFGTSSRAARSEGYCSRYSSHTATGSTTGNA